MSDKKLSFMYTGVIRGQGRPRHTRGGITYTAKKDREYRAALQKAFKDENSIEPLTCPVAVEIHVHRQKPKSAKASTMQPDTFKPDIDNIAKAVLDALNGLAWVDDKQVVDLHVIKFERTMQYPFMTVFIEGVEE